ncbi:cupin domain-containing protein [Vibrio campbellii]|uniref:Cupin domain-containing protein n=1 Tax=Vibrio campbellii TaxID=680 RepID=A0AAQ2Y164_9VIBR|nr:cupin domain-containing protein [Vibrio campbellii]WDG08974.1 cupin domain-containing protein [Vibrio campbellii]
MNINSNFDRLITVHAEEEPWSPSPAKGVVRKMFDRIGGEKAMRATSIVKFATNSNFPVHTHDGGEEFLVLDGVFQDEHGEYPVGSYVRNPPGSKHSPRTEQGCTIFVKLGQFTLGDRAQFVIDTTNKAFISKSAGVSEIPLYNDDRECVRIEKWEPATVVDIPVHKGLEVLVLEGQFMFRGTIYKKHSWLRLPVEHGFTALTGAQGARLWIKSDHLVEPVITKEKNYEY